MFKCLDSHTGSEIIILDQEWMGERLGELRAKSRQKALLCPGCRQPVLVRAGEIRSWHFAHRDLSSCPLQSESVALLKARGLLYHWLRAKFPDRDTPDHSRKNVVSIEKHLADDLPRPCDCYVETAKGKRIVYWIVERNIRNRYPLIRCTAEGVLLRLVFLEAMLRPVEGENNSFDLTTTERELPDRSTYDGLYGGCFGSLHYLDQETERLTTLRGIRLVHAPQRHHCRVVLSNRLAEMQTCWSGEFIHPGEHEALEQRRVVAPPRKTGVYAVREASLPQPYASTRHADSQERTDWGKWLAERKQQHPDRLVSAVQEGNTEETLAQRRARGEEPMTCRECGKQTTAWVEATLDAGICLCSECNQRLWEARKREHPQ